MRTVQLPYISPDSLLPVLLDLRRRQSRLIRTAYNRLCEGLPEKELYQALRQHPVGQGLHTWLTLSGINKAKALHSRFPEGKVVFGGRKKAILRSQGKITHEDWKASRLLPLYIEGHAKSHGKQGGNHLSTLDLANNQVIFHPSRGVAFPLVLRLSHKSKTLRRRLEELQLRCDTVRDTPFSVSLTETLVSISWSTPPATLLQSIPGRVLALDLNPSRIGWAVVDGKPDASCKVAAWGIYEYPELNKKLGLASNQPARLHQTNKRKHELSILAKEIEATARHYQVSAVVTERLGLGAKDHQKGKRFNRLVNNCWFKSGFTQVLVRRLQEAGILHAEVNPAYSSKIGNLLWATPLQIPDPACAAVEIGRRALFPLPFQSSLAKSGKQKVGQLRKHVRPGRSNTSFLGWSRVWSQVKPKASDTRRLYRDRLEPMLLLCNPRLSPLTDPRSKVLRFEPRQGATASFGKEFQQAIAGIPA
jgi:IS605 OrfB family transposase